MGMASTGFSVKAGVLVEVYAKAISEKELFTCDSTAYYIKTLTTSDPKTVNSNIVLSALQRLNIEVTGQPKQVELELPSNLSDANWGMKKTVCEEGGYNLSAYAGKTLLFTSYPINEVWNNTEPLNVWVATSGDTLVCVYKAVRENSMVAPGIFSIKENSNIKKK